MPEPINDLEWNRRLNIALEKLSEDKQENFHERAGIMEFDGGLTRREAERAAWKIVVGDPK